MMLRFCITITIPGGRGHYHKMEHCGNAKTHARSRQRRMPQTIKQGASVRSSPYICPTVRFCPSVWPSVYLLIHPSVRMSSATELFPCVHTLILLRLTDKRQDQTSTRRKLSMAANKKNKRSAPHLGLRGTLTIYGRWP